MNTLKTFRGTAARLVRALGCLRNRRLAASDGAALVEFAMALPAMLVILTGMCVFGIAIMTYIEVVQATGVGARLLAVSRGQTLDPCAAASASVKAAAPNLTPGSFTFSLTLNGTTYNGTTCSSTSYTTGAPGNLVQGATAKITVKYPCSMAIYGTDYSPGCKITSAITEIVQ